MKLQIEKSQIALVAETAEERDACALLGAVDGHVFRLGAADHGFTLVEIGPEDDARRAPLNITRSAPMPFTPISNLFRTPFELDGVRYASIEGFWQGLKYPDPARRKAIARLSDTEAKEAGNAAGQPDTFAYDGATIRSGSPEHWALMRRACEAKFSQNGEARAALLATGDRWLVHKVPVDSRNIPGVVMADIWTRIRDDLRASGA